jgi:hypothetical protein
MWLFGVHPPPVAIGHEPGPAVAERRVLPSTAFPDATMFAETIAGGTPLQAPASAPLVPRSEPSATKENTLRARAPSVRRSVGYRGSVSFGSEPSGAKVFVDGQQAGSTPLVLNNLAIGSRVVRVEAQGYQTWSGAVRLVANKQARVFVKLDLAP